MLDQALKWKTTENTLTISHKFEASIKKSKP